MIKNRKGYPVILYDDIIISLKGIKNNIIDFVISDYLIKNIDEDLFQIFKEIERIIKPETYICLLIKKSLLENLFYMFSNINISLIETIDINEDLFIICKQGKYKEIDLDFQIKNLSYENIVKLIKKFNDDGETILNPFMENENIGLASLNNRYDFVGINII